MNILGIDLYSKEREVMDDEAWCDYQTKLINDTLKAHGIDGSKPILYRNSGRNYIAWDIDEVIECLAIKDGINIAETSDGNMAIIAYYNLRWDIAEILGNATDEDEEDF